MSSTSSQHDHCSGETDVSQEQRNETNNPQSKEPRESPTTNEDATEQFQNPVRKRRARVAETAKERVQRFSLYSARRRKARTEETPEQRVERLSLENARRRRARAKETAEERAERLFLDNIRRNRARAEETPEKRAQRLSLESARRRRARAEMTVEERAQRLLLDNARKKRTRAEGTTEDRAERLSLDNARRAVNRARQQKNFATTSQVCCNVVQGETSSRKQKQETNDTNPHQAKKFELTSLSLELVTSGKKISRDRLTHIRRQARTSLNTDFRGCTAVKGKIVEVLTLESASQQVPNDENHTIAPAIRNIRLRHVRNEARIIGASADGVAEEYVIETCLK